MDILVIVPYAPMPIRVRPDNLVKSLAARYGREPVVWGRTDHGV